MVVLKRSKASQLVATCRSKSSHVFEASCVSSLLFIFSCRFIHIYVEKKIEKRDTVLPFMPLLFQWLSSTAPDGAGFGNSAHSSPVLRHAFKNRAFHARSTPESSWAKALQTRPCFFFKAKESFRFMALSCLGQGTTDLQRKHIRCTVPDHILHKVLTPAWNGL